MNAQTQSTCGNTPMGGPAATCKVNPADQVFASPQERAAMAPVRWKNGSTLKVGFLNRKDDDFGQLIRRKVQEIAPTWSQFANIRFEFVEGPTDQITINFSSDLADPGTYSSQLGVQSADFSGQGKPSMNLVFDQNNAKVDDDEFHRVILHEFGHALGLIHEHARPDGDLVWDDDAVRKYYIKLTSAQWDWDTIQERVIQLYNDKIEDKTEFDTRSIMMYRFPEGLATYKDGRPFSSDWNRTLSALDQDFIARMYPA